MRATHLMSFCAGVLVLLSGALGRAQGPAPPSNREPRVVPLTPMILVSATLDYRAGPGTASCPSVTYFRQQVMVRALHDAFRLDPAEPAIPVGSVQAGVTRTAQGFVATATWRGPDGATIWTETFTDPACWRAMDLVAFGLGTSFWLKEVELARAARAKTKAKDAGARKAKPEPASRPDPCYESPYFTWPAEGLVPLPKPKPPPPVEKPFALRFGASAWVERVATDFGSYGFAVEAGVRWRFVYAGVEAHGDPPFDSNQIANVGPVSFARVSGALLLCAQYGWFAACGVADAGRLFFPNHVEVLPASAFYGAAGVRTRVLFPLAPALFLDLALDLRAPIHPAHYMAGNTSVFSASGAGYGLGIGMSWELPR